MRLHVTAAFILAAISLPAANLMTLGLVVRHEANVPNEVRQNIEAEAARGMALTLQEANWTLHWRDETTSLPGESFDRLVVVDFKGDCSTVMPRYRQRRGALGWTNTSDGRIQPFISVDCDQVKNALMVSEGWPHALIPARLLGRALSRVALHEIYHVLSERKHHDSEGLFKESYSSADLLDPTAQVEHARRVVAAVPVHR